jgi:hypothetical protein
MKLTGIRRVVGLNWGILSVGADQVGNSYNKGNFSSAVDESQMELGGTLPRDRPGEQ